MTCVLTSLPSFLKKPQYFQTLDLYLLGALKISSSSMFVCFLYYSWFVVVAMSAFYKRVKPTCFGLVFIDLTGCGCLFLSLKSGNTATAPVRAQNKSRNSDGAFNAPRNYRIEWNTTWKNRCNHGFYRFYRCRHVANDASRFHPSIVSDARWMDRCTRIVHVCIDLPIRIDLFPHP